VRFLGLRFLLRSPEVNSVGSVLRGRGLEIIDDEGRARASIKLQPASVLPDGTVTSLPGPSADSGRSLVPRA
jgi:hypothetical protein